MEEDKQVARLWRVNRTIHELVRDRGYQVSDEEINISLADFQAAFAPSGNVDRKALNFFAEADKNDALRASADASEEGERIFVFYSEEPNVGVKTIRQFIGALDQQGISRGIIIWSEKLTPAARKVLEAMQQQFVLEDFDEASLLVNITHHTLVPTHEVMTPLEKKELLARYRLKENQLPRILPKDPVARYFGLTRGQVVRIIRPSETAGRYCSYRICY